MSNSDLKLTDHRNGCCQDPTADLPQEIRHVLSRRVFLKRTSAGLGLAALGSLLDPKLFASTPPAPSSDTGILRSPHFPPKVKHVIYLFQSGGPSHLDLFDYKPKLNELHGKDLPASVRGNQRLTLMTRNQKQILCVGSPFRFSKQGQSGAELSELLPHTAQIVDEICIIRSLFTEPINHDPAVTFMQTGSQVAGRPCMGTWLTWGLGSENADIPSFVVMLSGPGDQPVLSRYWHNGFLPAQFQGVQFQSGKDPVLFLNNPDGIDHANRGHLISAVNQLNQIKHDEFLDPEIQARINSFEMAYRMQTSVPDLMDLKSEPKHVLDMYGPGADKPGNYAANCLLARRLVERGVRFVQLYHRGWDQHGNLLNDVRRQAKETDQASAALLSDLKQRGLLEETLVIWGGEFGRTSYAQGEIGPSYGRDHHPRCFTVWLAGGGVRGGITYGKTDDFGYNLVENGVHVHDLHATLLHLLGIDHERLTYKYLGRDFRLTDVAGNVVRDILA